MGFIAPDRVIRGTYIILISSIGFKNTSIPYCLLPVFYLWERNTILPLQMYFVLALALRSSLKKQEIKELKQLKRPYDPI